MDLTFKSDFSLTGAEKEKYIEAVMEKADCKRSDIKSVSLSVKENDDIDVEYELYPRKFERIRRITGYLVGTTDRWNNAKRAELRDRVKHA